MLDVVPQSFRRWFTGNTKVVTPGGRGEYTLTFLVNSQILVPR
jgi:hypothetical protein